MLRRVWELPTKYLRARTGARWFAEELECSSILLLSKSGILLGNPDTRSEQPATLLVLLFRSTLRRLCPHQSRLLQRRREYCWGLTLTSNFRIPWSGILLLSKVWAVNSHWQPRTLVPRDDA